MISLVVVDTPTRLPVASPDIEVVTAREYLSQPRFSALRRARVFNLCRSYRYQTVGHYVSLLAEARGHRPLPSIATIQDLRLQPVIRIASQDLDKHIQSALHPLKSDRFELSIYFGRNVAKRYDRLCLAIFNQFPAPFLRASFQRHEKWELSNVNVVAWNGIPEEHRPFVIEQAQSFFTRSHRRTQKKPPRFDMAILLNGDSATAPSNEKAIERFIEAADSLDMRAEVIGRDAYGRIGEYDALFIRETTAVNHYTYRFARRAEAEGLVVMDDPESILKCTNKVYLSELLDRYRLRTPKTTIVSRDTVSLIKETIGYPCVIKQPDSSFSLGVHKIESEAEVNERVMPLFDESELLIAQEFAPTPYDWRVGVINGEPLYVCKYHMAKKHWQIIKRDARGIHEGNADTLRVEEAPQDVVALAVKAAKLMGDGLYGVDLKELRGKPVVIEVNDNPNVDAGVEDRVLGKELYRRIMQVFLNRIEAKRAGDAAAPPSNNNHA